MARKKKEPANVEETPTPPVVPPPERRTVPDPIGDFVPPSFGPPAWLLMLTAFVAGILFTLILHTACKPRQSAVESVAVMPAERVNKSVYLGEMKAGDCGWVCPHALHVDDAGKCYLDPYRRAVSEKEYGSQLYVSRLSSGYAVTIHGRDQKWEGGGKADRSYLPVHLLLDSSDPRRDGRMLRPCPGPPIPPP